MKKKPTSLAKIEANRRNALKSTGPKTREGKIAVKWNALKHGLLAREVLIQTGDGQESEAEFSNLHEQLRDDLQPDGILEEMLVERIAVCYWRLRRVLRSEVGEIRKNLDSARLRGLLERLEQLELAKSDSGDEERSQKLQTNSLGLKYLMTLLDQATRELEETGDISVELMDQLEENFGTEEGGFFSQLSSLCNLRPDIPEKAEEDPLQNGQSLTPREWKRGLLRLINKEKQRLQVLKERFEKAEKLGTGAMLASLALPSKEVVDKILRYETTIERQLYRAMQQLERLQRRRRGEPTIPPIAIDVVKEE